MNNLRLVWMYVFDWLIWLGIPDVVLTESGEINIWVFAITQVQTLFRSNKDQPTADYALRRIGNNFYPAMGQSLAYEQQSTSESSGLLLRKPYHTQLKGLNDKHVYNYHDST